MGEFKELVPVDSSIYPKKSFVGELQDMYIKERNGNSFLTLEFVNNDDLDHPLEASIIGIDYLDELNADGNFDVKNIYSLGKFLQSLSNLDVKLLANVEDSLVETQPSLIGKQLDMNANLRKTITADKGEQEWPNWTVDKISDGDGEDTSPVATSTPLPKKTTAKEIPYEELKEEWLDIARELTADAPQNEMAMQKAMMAKYEKTTDAYKKNPTRRTQLSNVRKQVLMSFIDSGEAIFDENEKYQVI